MDVSLTNGVAQSTYSSDAKMTGKTSGKPQAEKTEAPANSEAAVFEKSAEKKASSSNQIYNKDSVVAKLKADQQARIESMQSLVQKLLGKQVELFDLTKSNHLADSFREAANVADPETIAAAKESIGEDGYWGVNQTSDRLVSMAIALSGGDTAKADEMMSAIEKGYKLATKAWGEDLPGICQQTMDATRQKMDDWKSGKTTAADYSNYLN